MKDSGKKYLKMYKKETERVEAKLASLLKGKYPLSLYEPCSYVLNAGGKRLRPFLVLISARAANGNFNIAYNAAIAVEVLHNFTLVHDDIMDNSDMRRGRLTVHKKYDVNTAILAGDNLIALAYQSLLKDCKKNSKQIISTFTRGIIEVCEGQSLDKEFEIRDSVTHQEYKTMIYKKTAALAQMCCSLGAQLATDDKKTIQAISNYGKYLGMAFQIQDDLLDIIGQEDEFGKKIGSDLIEGKKTYLFLKALEVAKGDDKVQLEKIIRNKGINKNEVEFYKSLYEKLGILDYAKKEIERYTKLALKSLTTLKNHEGKELMNWLANVLINRNK